MDQSKFRIGIILRSDYSPQTGGGSSYYEILCEAIDRHEFDPALEFVFIRLEDSGRKETLNKKLIRINAAANYSGREKLIAQSAKSLKKTPFFNRMKLVSQMKDESVNIRDKHIARQLAKNEVDILYFLNPTWQSYNYPFVETHWDIGQHSTEAFPEFAMNHSFEVREKYYNKILKKAFAVFVESDAGKEELIRYTGINQDRIHMIPIFPGKMADMSVPEEEMQKSLKEFGLEAKKYFFYPAQFWSHKNHYAQVAALKIVAEKYPDLKLVFSGSDKGNLVYIKELAKQSGLSDRVVITGFVSNEAIYSLYKNALALTMTTYLGPTNLPLLEAERIGIPVICTDLKGHREQLGDRPHVHYIKPNNIQQLAEVMITVCQANHQVIPAINEKFNLQNALKHIELSFLEIMHKRKAFGFNFKQF